MMPTHGSTDPFHWLRLAIVHEDAGYRELIAQMASPEAASWLRDLLGPRRADNHPFGPAAELLVNLQRDLRARTADPRAPLELDPLLREEALAAIADLAPPSHGAWAREALRTFAPAIPTASSPMLSAGPPHRIGAYELLGLIGHGSSSAVYKGRHVDNGMHSAVKLLRLETADTESVVRFRTEAKIAGRLRHPAIAQILDSGVEPRGGSTVPYLVYAFAEGSPFAQALANAEPDRIVRVFGTLCDAIAYAHRHGVLHRDLKSANVLVDAADRVAVLDFGIARLIDGGAIRQTQVGQVLGTLQTMSPEQAAGISVDVRSDVWSLGAMLFEAFAGEVPFDLRGKAGAAALRCISETQPRRLSALRVDLDPDLVAVVHKALATDPADRYPSVEHLQEDLQRWQSGLPVTVRRLRAWPSLWRFARRHRVAAATGLTVLLAIMVGSALAAWQWQRALIAEGLARAAVLETLQSLESTLYAYSRLAETTTDSEAQKRELGDALAALARARAKPIAGQGGRWVLVEARIREILGDLALRTECLAEARHQREAVLRLYENLQPTGSCSTTEVARAAVKLGDLAKRDSIAGAMPHYRRAHALLVQAHAGAPDDLDVADELVWSFERLAAAAIAAGDPQAAVTQSRQQIDLAERLLACREDGLRHYGLASALDLHRQCLDAANQAPGAAALALRLRAREHARQALASDPRRRAFLNLAIAIELHLVFDPATQDPPARQQALRFAEHLVGTWIAGDPHDLDANLRLGQVLQAQAQRASEDGLEAASRTALWVQAVQHADRLAATRFSDLAYRLAANRTRTAACQALLATDSSTAREFAQTVDNFWRSLRAESHVPAAAWQEAEQWFIRSAPHDLRDARLAAEFAHLRAHGTPR